MKELLPWASVLVAVIGAIAGFFKVLKDAEGAKGASAVDFNKTLIERVETLEGKVSNLEGELQSERRFSIHALSFIERLAWMWPLRKEGDRFPPLPAPLQERLDPSWESPGEEGVQI